MILIVIVGHCHYHVTASTAGTAVFDCSSSTSNDSNRKDRNMLPIAREQQKQLRRLRRLRLRLRLMRRRQQQQQQQKPHQHQHQHQQQQQQQQHTYADHHFYRILLIIFVMFPTAYMVAAGHEDRNRRDHAQRMFALAKVVPPRRGPPRRATGVNPSSSPGLF